MKNAKRKEVRVYEGKRYFAYSLCFIATLLVGCGEKSKYETDLENGVRKYDNGEEMTKDEYEAVKDMKDWSAKQKEENSKKTYSDWNN